MLLYEYRVRDQFDRLLAYAQRVQTAFEEGRAPSELISDTENLAALYDTLKDMLPESIRRVSNIGRHLYFMRLRLGEGSPDLCRSDINDICGYDIPSIEKAFRDWTRSNEHYDDELSRKIQDLVARHEYDSAVRKAFVILKERLATNYNQPRTLDGPELINRILGRTPAVELDMSDQQRQALRDLLAGMYGVFRNQYAHSDREVSWYEADAIIAMVNFLLKDLGKLAPHQPRSGR